MPEWLSQFAVTLLIIMGICLVIAVVGLALLVRRIRQLQVPHEADFFTTMRHVPLILAIMLDLLDFALDIFSAPIMWVVLDRMGLPNLRNKAVIEALIPITNVIPTFTVAWFLTRVLNLGEQPDPRRFDIPRRQARADRGLSDARQYAPAAQRTRRTIDMDER